VTVFELPLLWERCEETILPEERAREYIQVQALTLAVKPSHQSIDEE